MLDRSKIAELNHPKSGFLAESIYESKQQIFERN